jgi:arylsulfatase
MVRWPSRIQPNRVSNEIISHQDWLPTLLAAVGDANIKEKLKAGTRVGGTRYKVHLDGYNFLPHFTGDEAKGPRKEFIYTSDTGDIIGLREGDFKLVFKEQRSHGAAVWTDPWTTLRAPKLFNLRMDPFERADYEAAGYTRWWAEHMFLFAPGMAKVAQFKATFEEFPQRQKPGSFVP